MKVFVLCPPSCVGGDREALEQLVLRARALGFDARLSRVWESSEGAEPGLEPLHPPIDAPDSVIVVTELELARLLEYRLARRVIWWCNFDRFTRTNEGLRRALGRAQGPLDFAFDERFCIHWARSVHCRQRLEQRGLNASLLGAYIEPGTLSQARQLRSRARANLVLFDDRSGTELVQKIAQRLPSDVRFIGMSQVSVSETAELIAQAKVYLDFGTHSDFEPLLCTAVAAGCVAIVGTQGRAGNAEDLPLPEAYKFDERDPSAPDAIAGLLLRVLSDPGKHSVQFEAFRTWLEAGEARFSEQVFSCLGTLEAAERRAQKLAI